MKNTTVAGLVLAGCMLSAAGCGGDEADVSSGSSTGGDSAAGGAAGAPAIAGGAAGEGATGTGVRVSTGNIDVTTDDCEFEACGGDLANTTWDYSEGCLFVGALMRLCPPASYDVQTSLSGSLVFAVDEVTRNMLATTSGTAMVPEICAMGAACADVATSWQLLDYIDDAECEAVDGGCACTIGGSEEQNDTAAYTVVDQTLTVVGPDLTRTFDFCVSGDTLTYLETTPGAASPGVFQLTRRP